MLDDYNLIKFVIVFGIIVITLFAVYLYINKYGGFPVYNQKGKIKILEIKQVSKDKGFILAQVQNKFFFFSFDNSGIKLIEKFENSLDEESKSNISQ